MGSSTITAILAEVSENAVVIDGTTLSQGGSAITVDGRQVSVGTAGLVVDGSQIIPMSAFNTPIATSPGSTSDSAESGGRRAFLAQGERLSVLMSGVCTLLGVVWG